MCVCVCVLAPYSPSTRTVIVREYRFPPRLTICPANKETKVKRMASTGFEGKFLGGGRRENYASDSEEEEDFKDALDDTLKPAEDGLPQVWAI